MRFRSDPPNTLRGSIAPVVTPFTAEGKLDTDGLRGLIRWQLASGSHGISLGGSTGEPSAQTVQERIAAMDAAAGEIADRVPFLPGTGSAMLEETLELTAHAQEIGADAVLVITPYYTQGPPAGGPVLPGTTRSRGAPPTSRCSSTTSRPAPPSTSPPRPSRACAASTPASSASRRPPGTSSTSPASCTCAAATRWSCPASNSSASPWLALGGARASSARSPTSRPEPSPRCTRPGTLRATRTPPATCTTRLHPLVDLIFTRRPTPAPRQVGPPRGGPAHLRARQAALWLLALSDKGRRKVMENLRAGLTGAQRPGRPRWPKEADQNGRQTGNPARPPQQARPLHKRRPHPQRGRRHVRGRRPGHEPALRHRRGRRPRGRGPRRSRRHGRLHQRPVAPPDRPRSGRDPERCRRRRHRNAHGARIAELEAFDTGLPITQARGQAARAAENFRFFADLAVTLHEDVFRAGGTQFSYVIRQPAGVAGLITPWNTPFMLETWKLAPALAAGCTVVLKLRPEWTPLSASLAARDHGRSHGLPDWRVQPGPRDRRGGRLPRWSRTPASRASRSPARPRPVQTIMAAAAPHLKGLSMELGGKSPCVIFADADLDRAVDSALFGVFSLNGERCTAGSRILAERAGYDRLVNQLGARAANIPRW